MQGGSIMLWLVAVCCHTGWFPAILCCVAATATSYATACAGELVEGGTRSAVRTASSIGLV